MPLPNPMAPAIISVSEYSDCLVNNIVKTATMAKTLKPQTRKKLSAKKITAQKTNKASFSSCRNRYLSPLVNSGLRKARQLYINNCVPKTLIMVFVI